MAKGKSVQEAVRRGKLQARQMGVGGEVHFREFAVGGDCIISCWSKNKEKSEKCRGQRGSRQLLVLFFKQRRWSLISAASLFDIAVVCQCLPIRETATATHSKLVELTLVVSELTQNVTLHRR